MTSKIKFFLLLLSVLSYSYLFALNIDFENTWTKYTVYKPGTVIVEDKLFVNAFCSIECYDILNNGQIELSDVIEFNSVILMIEFDESNDMLYVHCRDYLDSGSDWIYQYQIIDGSLIFNLRFEASELIWNFNDLIYPVGDYVILYQPGQMPCYIKQTQELMDVTYPYDEIIGSFDDKLVEYSYIDSKINFYKVIDINDPVLIFQCDNEMIAPHKSFLRVFNNSNCLLIDKSQVFVFDVSDEQNYIFESIWPYNFNTDHMLFEPLSIGSDQLYIGSNAGENFVFNVSDFNSPILLYNWLEVSSEVNWYDIYNNRYLFRSENDNGIWMYDLDDLPSTQYVVLGYVFPYLSTAFIDGLIYKNDTEYLYKVDPETLEEDIICEFPYSVSSDYFKHENLLIIRSGSLFEDCCVIVDLDTNQLLNDIPLNGVFLYMQGGKIFIQNDEIISVYEINSQYELDYLTNFAASNTLLLTDFDEDHVWVSYDDGDFLFNTITLQIDHDFSNFFSPSSSRLAKPFKYDNKLIITDLQPPLTANISLYDIYDLANPILLDSKVEEMSCSYLLIDDYLIESQFLNPARIYNKFTVSFTEPIQTYDFETAIFDLVIDEENKRIASTSSYYYFKTYNYELTGIGIEIIPENDLQISNYPNPFNPETIISFTSDTAITEKMELLIYNLKGQKVDQLEIGKCVVGVNEVIWNAERFASGIYLYQLKADGEAMISKKCLLIK